MKKYFLSAVSVVVILLVSLVVGIQTGAPGEADAQIGSGLGNFDIAGPVIVKTDVTVNDDLTVKDDSSFVDDVTITGDLFNDTFTWVTAQSTATVTAGGTVAPSTSYVRLTSAGNVGTSSISGCTAGDTYSKLVTLVNMGSNTITFTDTSTLKLSGNIALGQYDSLVIRCDNGHGNWIQLSTSNN
jgi:hypothetical protein